MKKKKWYGVKTLYKSNTSKKSKAFLFEERVVLFRAHSFNQAVSLAEKEARDYEHSWLSGKTQVKLEYIGVCDAYLLESSPGEGREVFSSTSFYESDLTKSKLTNERLGPKLTENRRKKMQRMFFRKPRDPSGKS